MTPRTHVIGLLLGLFALAVLGCASGARRGKPAAARPTAHPEHQTRTVRLTILATNDLHGQLAPRRIWTAEQPPRSLRVGGAEALAATIASLRADDPEGTILLDAGDMFQGSLLSNRFEGLPVRDLYGAIGYDAVTVGNHEFDFGPVGSTSLGDNSADPCGALKRWIGGAPFPVLAANVRRADGQALQWPNLRPSTEIVRRGIRVGVIGLATPSTAVTTLPAHVRDLEFQPMLPAVLREAARLRRHGAQVIIVLAHEGGACAGRDPESCKGPLFANLTRRLPPELVDVVVGGHTHRCIWHTVAGVPVIESCSGGRAVGRVQLQVSLRGGTVIQRKSRVLPPAVTCHDVFSDTGQCEAWQRRGPRRGTVQPNPALERHSAAVARAHEAVQEHRRRLGEAGSKLLARLPEPLRHRRFASTRLGALFTRAMLAAVPEADIAMMNAGALRADLPAGEVRRSQLFTVFPFDNRLATVELTGEQVREILDVYHARSRGLMQVAGLRLDVSCSPPFDVRALAMEDGRPIAPDELYTVVISDFLLSGGDGLGKVLDQVPQERKHVHGEGLIRDVVRRYLLRAAAGKAGLDELLRPAEVRFIGQGACRASGRPTRRPICR